MRYTLRTFFPLIIVFCIVILFATTRQLYSGSWNLMNAMTDFMAAYFILFGAIKLVTWHSFAKTYQTYDLISQYGDINYAYSYPFIQLAIGIAYLFHLLPIVTNAAAFLITVTNGIGIALALSKGDEMNCACLGTVFTMPLTYISLLKNILVASMALGILLSLIF